MMEFLAGLAHKEWRNFPASPPQKKWRNFLASPPQKKWRNFPASPPQNTWRNFLGPLADLKIVHHSSNYGADSHSSRSNLPCSESHNSEQEYWIRSHLKKNPFLINCFSKSLDSAEVGAYPSPHSPNPYFTPTPSYPFVWQTAWLWGCFETACVAE